MAMWTVQSTNVMLGGKIKGAARWLHSLVYTQKLCLWHLGWRFWRRRRFCTLLKKVTAGVTSLGRYLELRWAETQYLIPIAPEDDRFFPPRSENVRGSWNMMLAQPGKDSNVPILTLDSCTEEITMSRGSTWITDGGRSLRLMAGPVRRSDNVFLLFGVSNRHDEKSWSRQRYLAAGPHHTLVAVLPLAEL